jgi:ATP-dependent protease Clp ATPase subunit
MHTFQPAWLVTRMATRDLLTKKAESGVIYIRDIDTLSTYSAAQASQGM